MSLSIDSTVSASREQVSSELAGEIVILSLSAGIYHGLDATGARVWQLIQRPKKVSEIRDLLLQEYDVEPKVCESDLLELLEDLSTHRLLQVHEKPAD